MLSDMVAGQALGTPRWNGPVSSEWATTPYTCFGGGGDG
jgi:hypothetical protein